VENASVNSPEKTPMKEGKPVAQGMEVITLGGGCFWCTEAVIERLEGVSDVVSGYMGGHVESPTYEQICTKTTGHAEVIQVTFDPSKIKLEEVLDVFWQAHDPTTLNRQGADQGPQYRSVIFYHSPEQKNIAVQSKAKLDASGMYGNPAVTEISEAAKFWEAEDYHQNYYVLNKDKNPYCRVVISPKLKKLGME
jgi:peptide-methionine (S)-S-oxide reductase